MRDDFRVRLGLELVSRFLQRLLQREEVLDDPVVDDDDLPGAVAVRVRVVLVRLPVRGPARVAHPERAFEVVLGQLRLEVRQLPLRAHDVHARALAVSTDDRDPRAVVPAILELLQSPDQNRDDVTIAYVADDSAHRTSVMSNE